MNGDEEPEYVKRDIRVVVVEDHALVRAGMRKLVESFERVTVVGEASDTDQAIAVISELKPDVAIVDLQLPGEGGVAVLKEVAKSAPDTKNLVVTMYDDYAYIVAALEAGAHGYLLKTADRSELKNAILTVATGATVLDTEVAERMQRRWRDAKAPVVELTSRELDVLQAIAKGASNKQIAFQLGIGTRTVEGYVSSLLAKLGVRSRTEAALWAVDHHAIDGNGS